MLRWIYFHQRLFLYIILVPYILGLVFLSIVFSVEPFALSVFIPSFFLLLGVYSLLLWANLHTHKEALRVLNRNCDPGPLLQLSLWDIQRQPSLRAVAHNNAGVALLALGYFAEALKHLDPAYFPKESKQQPITVLSWSSRSAVMFACNDPEEMAHCLSMAETALRSCTTSSQYATLASDIAHNQLLYRLLVEGTKPEIESALQQVISFAESEYRRVLNHFVLAQCALERKGWAEARGHLEYVAEHGNNLYVRRQALELLDQLNAEEGTPC